MFQHVSPDGELKKHRRAQQSRRNAHSIFPLKHCHIVYHYRQPHISTVMAESSCMGDSRDECRNTLIWANRWEVGASQGTCSASGHGVPQPAWCLCDVANIFVANSIHTLSYFTWKLHLFHRFKPSLWFSCWRIQEISQSRLWNGERDEMMRPWGQLWKLSDHVPAPGSLVHLAVVPMLSWAASYMVLSFILSLHVDYSRR